MKIFARHGDVVIRQQPVTGELAPATDLVIAGSSSSPHTVRGACQYRLDGQVTSVRLAADTVIEHAGRHKPIPLPAGDYQFSALRERGDKDDRKVED
jgi:hypothetical protein